MLHVIRYPSNARNQVIDADNRSGYGLTLGIESRIDASVQPNRERAHGINQYRRGGRNAVLFASNDDVY